MKRHFFILITCLVCITLLPFSHNKQTIRVLDNEHILTPAQVNSLDSLYKAHEKITTNEMALVTTPDFGKDSGIVSFATRLGNKYGIGKKGKDNGILIVFSEAQRQVRISTGYGTEKILTDAIAKKIIDSLMTPEFKQANYFDGLWQGSKAIVTFLEKPANRIN